MKKIAGLRLLPPFAIARLGSDPEPLENYTLEDDPAQPLGFRRIVPAATLRVDETTGEIAEAFTPAEIQFKRDGRFRPVAPFFEVFAILSSGEVMPLTAELLAASGHALADLSWRVVAANRKAQRRTGDEHDAIVADTNWFGDHEPKPLPGKCANFLAGAQIDFGQVRFIRPNERFGEIRLRFTPAQGAIYGATAEKNDPTDLPPPGPIVYDHRKGTWRGFQIDADQAELPPAAPEKFPNETLPPQLFASVPPAPPWLNDNVAVSRGYLDDACDGIVTLRLAPKARGAAPLFASARFCAAPPMVVPDTLFLRNLADDLEQIVHGPDVSQESWEVAHAHALDIIRRAFETVRFLNVAVMNGNPFKGRDPLTFDTMPAEEAFDVQRAMRPVVSESAADTLTILALHQQVYAALQSGAAPWFARVLRLPEQAGDFTDHGRRKMPAMMCGADGGYLALTRRQINWVLRAAAAPPIAAESPPPPATARAKTAAPPPLVPRNASAQALSDQLRYIAAGNPPSTRPLSSVANCTPGLEVDFRAVWRRIFRGIVLREYDNLVTAMEPGVTLRDAAGKRVRSLAGHRLLRISFEDSVTRQRIVLPTFTTMTGPSPADPQGEAVVLATQQNPQGVMSLEWSNALAPVLQQRQNKTVRCEFTAEPVWGREVGWSDDDRHLALELEVRAFFEPGTAVISAELALPGELTQGLCSPWQNDYRECSCYYWASARPDFVNIEPSPSGRAKGDNWLQKTRTGDYVADDYADSRLVLYDDLFAAWESILRVQLGGRDAPYESPHDPTAPPPAVPPPTGDGAAK